MLSPCNSVRKAETSTACKFCCDLLNCIEKEAEETFLKAEASNTFYVTFKDWKGLTLNSQAFELEMLEVLALQT